MTRIEEMKTLREQGKTLQEIGDKFGITRERVRQLLERFNIPKRVCVKKEILPYHTKIKFRLLRMITETPEGCWNFTGSKTKFGYGRMSYLGKSEYAHRVSYQIFNNVVFDNIGPISSETKCVLHICKNPSCINPDHLYIGLPMDFVKQRDLDKKLLCVDVL